MTFQRLVYGLILNVFWRPNYADLYRVDVGCVAFCVCVKILLHVSLD